MDSLVVTSGVFLIVMGGAFAGAWLQKVVPPHHLNDATKDMVKTGAGFIATLAALVLGLLVASAKSSYDAKSDELQQVAAKIILLDLTLRQMGPAAAPARDELRKLARARADLQWVKAESSAPAAVSRPPGSSDTFDLRARVGAIPAATDAERALLSHALQLVDDVMQTHWLFIEQSTARVSMPLLIVVILWLGTISACLGLFAPRNGTILVVTVLCAVSTAGAIFLIIEMYDPFGGLMKISDAPLRKAISYLQE